jgi:hypothetical protein
MYDSHHGSICDVPRRYNDKIKSIPAFRQVRILAHPKAKRNNFDEHFRDKKKVAVRVAKVNE